MMKISLILSLWLIPLAISAQVPASQFSPEWNSLQKHVEVPDWIRDAKFGIYCHWGVYSVPAYGNEQYYYYMHRDSTSKDFLMGGHNRHVEMYGPLSKFGYHDFIPMFKGEKFSADDWATLFKEQLQNIMMAFLCGTVSILLSTQKLWGPGKISLANWGPLSKPEA
jgi:alpha-L-fucosidase